MFESAALDCRQHSMYCTSRTDELIRDKIDEIKQIQQQKHITKDELMKHKVLSRYANIINRYLIE